MEEKRLSEFLKENGAYDAFIENCLKDEDTLQDIVDYNLLDIGIFSGFTWEETSEGAEYWSKIYDKSPNDITNDMDEVLYKEYEKNMKESSEQTPIPKDIVENDVETKVEATKLEFKPFTLNIEVNTLDEAKSLWNRFNLNYNVLCEAIQNKYYEVDYENRLRTSTYWEQLENILKDLGE